MAGVSSVLASVVLATALIPTQTPAPAEWIHVGRSQERSYDILRSSVELEVEARGAQFAMRTMFLKTPLKLKDGTEVRSMLERVVVFCEHDMLVSANRLLYNQKNEHVGTDLHAVVYQNPRQKGYVVSEIIKMVCESSSSETPRDKSKGLLTV